MTTIFLLMVNIQSILNWVYQGLALSTLSVRLTGVFGNLLLWHPNVMWQEFIKNTCLIEKYNIDISIRFIPRLSKMKFRRNSVVIFVSTLEYADKEVTVEQQGFSLQLPQCENSHTCEQTQSSLIKKWVEWPCSNILVRRLRDKTSSVKWNEIVQWKRKLIRAKSKTLILIWRREENNRWGTTVFLRWKSTRKSIDHISADASAVSVTRKKITTVWLMTCHMIDQIKNTASEPSSSIF